MSEFLETRRSLEGPESLWKHEENWPQTKLDISLDSGDREVTLCHPRTSSSHIIPTGCDSREQWPGT